MQIIAPDTGRVVRIQRLAEGVDYEIDHVGDGLFLNLIARF